ncbi:Spy/CpxP family protein refolding chaperone [Lyngbya confervoides]|uniref:Spy/CpxP family protein refolding chaperone n=1 Tax=Lyngbya confervoides BDU141951 TaxID=1574623 RepID=A0ABD4T341_9CYAN|nr:Spy/CpxP family protein refolding chaperone [Lyngbya confervoides]MCM1982811.1 Spy/CpxP family protein refolding chaperone [Lyngbya confervoides BDU141951]
MNIRTFSVLAAVPLLLAGTVPFALAENRDALPQLVAQASGSEKRENYQGRRFERMVEALNLSDGQADQIKAIHEQAQTESQGDRESLRAEMEQMRSLIRQGASVDQLRNQHNQIKAIRERLSEDRFERMLQTYEILSPEQRQKFADLHQGRRGGWGRKGSPAMGPQSLVF